MPFDDADRRRVPGAARIILLRAVRDHDQDVLLGAQVNIVAGLAQAGIGGALSADVRRVLLNVDQACGANLDKVLDERRETARKCGRTEDLVALGALLADLREFTDADRIYGQALEVSLIVNFIRLAYCRELRDELPHAGRAQAYLVGAQWAVAISSVA